ncbi:MAG: hypothetical protein U1F25_15720 [Rubrivivax sp.]
MTLSREADGRVQARIAPVASASHRLAGYWAVVEDQHVSHVSAGENAGETLRHDHVVRLYRRWHRSRPRWSEQPPRCAATGRRRAPSPHRLRRHLGAEARPLQAVALDLEAVRAPKRADQSNSRAAGVPAARSSASSPR